MKLTPRNINEICLNEEDKKSENLKTLEAFIESGFPCCEVEDFNQKSAVSAHSALYSSAKRFCGDKVTVIRRGDKVYLVRKEEA